MKSLVFLVGFSALLSLPCAAGPVAGGGNAVDEQFIRNKTIKQSAYRDKLAILQQSLACIERAQSWEAVKSCEETERAAMEQHGKQLKQRWDELKK